MFYLLACSPSTAPVWLDTDVTVGSAGLETPSLTVVTERVGRGSASLSVDHPGLLCADGACQHVELVAEDVTEHWERLGPDRYKHSWTVRRRAAGQGLLELDVVMDGGQARQVLGDVHIETLDETWRYAGVAAWDAGGVPLAAKLRAKEGRISVLVDDAGAEYPIRVDPVLSLTATLAVPASGLGFYSTAAGDLDDDGYDDVVGSGGYNAHAWFGSGTGVSGPPSETGGTARGPVATGDFDGDLTLDVAAWKSQGLTMYSQVFATSVSVGALDSDSVGYVLVAADVDDDGYDDLVSWGGTRAHIYYGSAQGLSDQDGQIRPATTLSTFTRAAAVVDSDGNGTFDLALGEAYGAIQGQVHVFAGSSTGLASTATTLSASDGTTSDGFGEVVGAGDVDNDGYEELVVRSNDGLYVYPGSASGLDSSREQKLDPGFVGAAYDQQMVVADLNGDGFDDVAVTDSDATVFLIEGSAGGLDVDTLTTITPLTGFCFRNLTVGDVNNDGYGDLIVTCQEGVEVYHGTCTLHTWYADTDDDGHGDPNGDTVEACEAPSGYAEGTDCDDDDPDINPDGQEVCDGLDADEDCDGLTEDDDDSVTGLLTWYADTDADLWGDPDAATITQCQQPALHAGNDLDCDDDDATVYPTADELCDGQLNDCQGDIGPREFDRDADGYAECTLDSGGWDGDGLVTSGDDCDDTDITVYPGASETDGDGIDSNCDGKGGPDFDEDGDGLTWSQEQAYGTSDIDQDSDDDGLDDGTEVNVHGTDPANADTDNDGVEDGKELEWGTDPLDEDSDDDGLLDGEDPDPLSPRCGCASGGESVPLTVLVLFGLAMTRRRG